MVHISTSTWQELWRRAIPLRQPGSRPSRFRTKQMAVLHIHRSTRRSLAILTRTRKWRTCSQRHNPQDIGDLAGHGGKRFWFQDACLSVGSQFFVGDVLYTTGQNWLYSVMISYACCCLSILKVVKSMAKIWYVQLLQFIHISYIIYLIIVISRKDRDLHECRWRLCEVRSQVSEREREREREMPKIGRRYPRCWTDQLCRFVVVHEADHRSDFWRSCSCPSCNDCVQLAK